MASRASNFCIDAHDPYAQTMWWAEVLEDFRLPTDEEGPNEPGDEECGLVGPDDRYLLFLKVPEPKTVKNRVHLDVNVGGGPAVPMDERRPRVDAAVERNVALGATVVEAVEELGEYRVIMKDPEGNEFCIQ